MTRRTRRVSGVVAMLAGIVLIVWSYCPLVMDALDFIGLVNTWDVTCPSKFWDKTLFISGIVALVVGQRLFSGRKLHTGEKVE